MLGGYGYPSLASSNSHFVSLEFVFLTCCPMLLSGAKNAFAGPTNSGKTYQAIERLKLAGANRQPGDSPAGIFCGPLRLLALEVYEQVRMFAAYFP